MVTPSNRTSFTQARVHVFTKVKEEMPRTPGEAEQGLQEALLSRWMLSCKGANM